MDYLSKCFILITYIYIFTDNCINSDANSIEEIVISNTIAIALHRIYIIFITIFISTFTLT